MACAELAMATTAIAMTATEKLAGDS